VEGEIRALRKRLRILERSAKKSGDCTRVKQLRNALGKLEQAYAAGKSKQNEEASDLERTAWIDTRHGAEMLKCLEHIAELRKAAMGLALRDRESDTGISETAKAVLADVDRIRGNHAELVEEVIRKEKSQASE